MKHREECASRGNSTCKDAVEGRPGDCEAWRASDGAMLGDEEAKAGDTGRSWAMWDQVGSARGSARPGSTVLLPAAEGTTGAFPPKATVTSSVWASIFLWVRPSRRAEGWTPRSCMKENQNAFSDLIFVTSF